MTTFSGGERETKSDHKYGRGLDPVCSVQVGDWKSEKNADVFGSYSTKTEKHADCIKISAKALNWRTDWIFRR